MVTDAILHRLPSPSADRTITGGALLDVPAGPNRIGSVKPLSTRGAIERTNGSNCKQLSALMEDVFVRGVAPQVRFVMLTVDGSRVGPSA